MGFNSGFKGLKYEQPKDNISFWGFSGGECLDSRRRGR